MAVNDQWPVAVKLEAIAAVPIGTIAAAEVTAAKALIKAELTRLNAVKCKGCGGPGHGGANCETGIKLSWISAGGAA